MLTALPSVKRKLRPEGGEGSWGRGEEACVCVCRGVGAECRGEEIGRGPRKAGIRMAWGNGREATAQKKHRILVKDWFLT